jgi:thiamine pyrophosphate-dependent acetolactate synthase large subunit-like protein
VLTTFKAKGLVPDTHPLGAGVLGRSGTPVASWLMNESDLLVVVGASFSNHTGIAPYKPIVQIDDTPTAIGRFDAVSASILGDAAIAVDALTMAVGDAEPEDQRPTSPNDGRSGVLRRPAAPPTTAEPACQRRPSSRPCPDICRPKRWSPWTWATTPTPWAATSSRRGNRC